MVASDFDMNKFFGEGELTFSGETHKSLLCLNLENDCIECYFPNEETEKEALIKSFTFDNKALVSNLTLKNIHFKLPNGELRKSHYDDFYVRQYLPGSISGFDSTLVRALNLRNEQIGLTKLILQPKETLVQSDFIDSGNILGMYKAFYTSNKIHIQPKTIKLASHEVAVKCDRKGLILIAEDNLHAIEEKFRLAWSILQGRALQLRAELSSACLGINFYKDEISGLGTLCSSGAALGLFEKLFEYLNGLDENEYDKWRRASYFYLEGICNIGFLETRTINLMVFLEMIDKCERLSKNTIKQLLQIKADDADLICRTRNRLFHKGDSLGEAVINAYHEMKSRREGADLSFFRVLKDDVQLTATEMYFKLAFLISRVWVEKAHYEGDFFHYYRLLENNES